MERRRRMTGVLLLALVLVAGTTMSIRAQRFGPEHAARSADTVGSSFTYQGNLTVGGAPADGMYDIEFKLFTGQIGLDQASGAGLQVNSAGNHGVFVDEVGDPSGAPVIGSSSGFEVRGSEGNGLSVGRADGDGVRVNSGNFGVNVQSADFDGVFVGEADADGDGTGVAGYFAGDVVVEDSLTKGGGGFKIDHPQNPEGQYLSHSFVEAPERTNVYNGNVRTDGDGYATLELPNYFEALNKDFTYQLTVVGTFAQAIVAEEIEDNTFVIQTDEPNVKVSWQVTGVRRDAWAEAHPLVVEEEKASAEAGAYVHPELYDQPASKSVGRVRRIEQGERD